MSVTADRPSLSYVRRLRCILGEFLIEAGEMIADLGRLTLPGGIQRRREDAELQRRHEELCRREEAQMARMR